MTVPQLGPQVPKQQQIRCYGQHLSLSVVASKPEPATGRLRLVQRGYIHLQFYLNWVDTFA